MGKGGEDGRPVGHRRGDEVVGAIRGDRVLAPRAAARQPVQKHRLQPVDRLREAGLRRRLGLELVPHGPQAGALVEWQHSEDPLGRELLAGFLIGPTGLVHGRVDERVAGIDLDEVVHEQHLDDAADIDRFVRVLGQHDGRQREMPRMLGRVLLP